LEQLKVVWDTSRSLAVQSSADENAAWQHFKNRVTYQQQNLKPVPVKKFSWMKVAASVLVLIGIGVLGLLIFNKQDTTKEIVFQSLQQVKIDTLPDASIVTLNKNSALTYPEEFRGNSRAVSLKGEAFFSVTPDKEKPFIISVDEVQVKVVGTSFNIREINDATEIVVETGIVEVTKNGQTIALKAGEKIVVLKKEGRLSKETVTDKLYNYYRTKEFVCDNTPLWKLVSVLNEAYGSNIAISNPAIKNMTITTTFYNEPLDVVLNIIKETLGITVTKNNNGFFLQ
jgi:ferric-dicitrate binding protein FerR (iron transport regulator)